MTNLELVSGKCYPKNLLDHICCWLQGPSGEAVSSEWIVKLELNSVMIGYGLNGMEWNLSKKVQDVGVCKWITSGT